MKIKYEFIEDILKNLKPVHYVNFENIKSLEIFDLSKYTEFQKFVINQRLNIMIFMKIIELYCNDSKFIFAFEEINRLYDEFEVYEDITKRKTIAKNVISKTKFTKNEIFENFISNFGFSQLIQEPEIENFDLEYYNKEKIEKYIESDTFENQLIISLNPFIIFYNNKIIFDNKLKNEIEAIIKDLNQKFELFLKKETEQGVPHEKYIEFLLNIFPGKIKVRSIECK